MNDAKNRKFAAAVLMTALPASAFAADGPEIVLPQSMIEAPSEQEAREDVLSIMRREISERYLAEESPVDHDRLDRIVSGEYLGEYTAPKASPVRFHNGVIDTSRPAPKPAPAPREAATPAAPVAAQGGLTLSPAIIRAMSAMSQDQIEAIALMMELSANPGATAAVDPRLTAGGVPSLSDANVDATDPAALFAALTQEPARPSKPRVVDVGDGTNLALEGWQAVRSPQGVALSNASMPSSRFTVHEGMVVGQFGLVTKVSDVPGALYVEFETGDRVEGLGTSITAGVPALEDRSRFGGEIIVSGGVPADPALSTSGSIEFPNGVDIAALTNSELAPKTSNRPQAKPGRP